MAPAEQRLEIARHPLSEALFVPSVYREDGGAAVRVVDIATEREPAVLSGENVARAGTDAGSIVETTVAIAAIAVNRLSCLI